VPPGLRATCATAAAMADLGDQDYHKMLCVETTNAGSDSVTIVPGENYGLAARYSLEHE
jgi:glucose-6-phosphate 1-epimerase